MRRFLLCRLLVITQAGALPSSVSRGGRRLSEAGGSAGPQAVASVCPKCPIPRCSPRTQGMMGELHTPGLPAPVFTAVQPCTSGLWGQHMGWGASCPQGRQLMHLAIHSKRSQWVSPRGAGSRARAGRGEGDTGRGFGGSRQAALGSVRSHLPHPGCLGEISPET